MGHHHGHDHDHSVSNIKVAFFLNLGFTLIEIIGGIYTNSLAILSDALHDLGDSLSLGLSWYFQKLSGRKRDQSFSYGYKRFSLMGAVINSIVLIIGSIFIIREAIPRIIQPESVNSQGMLILAIFGILVNGAAVLKLRKGDSINERVVSLHLLEDVLGWVAVLIASIVMIFTDVPVLDPILSLLIALYVLFNVYKNLKTSLKIILQGIPENANINGIKTKLESIEDILNVHDIHLWSLDGHYHILTVHLVVPGTKSMDALVSIKQEVKSCLSKENIKHVTIEFETEEEYCELEDC
ncbi:cation diffusion facilitator family transporter [Fulvivirgaceae bacterium BMA10]|uniref:Cation diffusion facilitator family transporter n=1 Tax=Splendidivirga corallicola TaxID=3051826 RepID=A0ABT8KKA3_9BACT|nr:cation diffusion facilitator family transporter [Fulvivirgaceae bacterium BMA10]